MSDSYQIGNDFIIDEEGQSIAFKINKEEYFFMTFLEYDNGDGTVTYQISFYSNQNIINKTPYQPMKPANSGVFLIRIFEIILLKHVGEFGDNIFVALPANDRLKRFYNAAAIRYSRNTNSSFVVKIIPIEDGGEYDTQYEIRRR